MMPDFPDDLPKPVWTDIGVSSPVGAVQETQMDTGPSKRRRRTTAKRSPVSLVFAPVTEKAADGFELFYAEDLAQGVLSFQMLHPIYERPATWRFSIEDAYTISPIGEDAFQLQISLELLS